MMNLRWRSGALGSVAVTMLAEPSNFESAITIVGARGLVRLGGVACDRVETWRFDETREEDENLPAPGESGCVYGVGHTPLYRNIVSTLRGEAQPDVDGVEGLKSLELVVAAYRSAQSGKRVSLPLEI